MHFNIIDKLKDYLKDSDDFKSSYWKDLKYSEELNNINKHFGFGSLEKKQFVKKYLHGIFQLLIFGYSLFQMKEYKNLKNFFDKNNRQINVDAIRHIYTFNFLKKKIEDPKDICVIGDGKANFIIGAKLNYPNSRIFSINLPEVLIHDFCIIKAHNLFKEDEISILEKKEDLKDNKIKLFLLPPQNIKILNDCKIDFFANICSFQEINMKEIIKYFDLIKQNKSIFYCCNRCHKKLPDGEEIIFKNYPWGVGKKIVDEKCPWIRKFYSFRPPFLINYEGFHEHVLINYNVEVPNKKIR